MSWPRVIEQLDKGPVRIRPRGNSMTPIIRSGDLVTLERYPIVPEYLGFPLEKGLIVLAKVKGRFYLHKITKVLGTYPEVDRVQISNNHGHVNGWTTPDRVYAVVTKVER